MVQTFDELYPEISYDFHCPFGIRAHLPGRPRYLPKVFSPLHEPFFITSIRNLGKITL